MENKINNNKSEQREACELPELEDCSCVEERLFAAGGRDLIVSYRCLRAMNELSDKNLSLTRQIVKRFMLRDPM